MKKSWRVENLTRLLVSWIEGISWVLYRGLVFLRWTHFEVQVEELHVMLLY